ncbi:MAG: hypothetical protein IJE66_04470 [Akkermansia sp.]|nr:hypothetical protein [Akkermansia sp.]MBQ2814244.1 hypothetical protein [Akkermansia sp.]
MKHLLTAAAALLVSSHALGQLPSDAVGPGEFPGLQLLPPGSVIEGISIPRYDKHRVTALFKADEMKVANRSVVELKKIVATMYSSGGVATVISTPGAEYSFATKLAFTRGEVDIKDPRFTAKGSKVLYHSGVQRGILVGPVHTTISASVLKPTKK